MKSPIDRSTISARIRVLALLAFILFVFCPRIDVSSTSRKAVVVDKSKVAFVYLADSSPLDLRHLNCSLKTLFTNFNNEHGYKVIILHEGIPEDVQQSLLIWPQIEFRKVQLSLEQSLNVSYSLPIRPRFRIHTRKAAYGYQHMCRFWFSKVFKHDSPLADLNYYIRFDTDSAFIKNIRRDFIADLISNRVKYGYNYYAPDCGQNVFGLRKFVSKYVRNVLKSVTHPNFWYIVQHPDNGDRKCMPSFYNNFEFVDLERFRADQSLTEWFDAVDAEGRIYRNRWGDAPLRFLTLALFFRPHEVKPIRLSSFGGSRSHYFHGFRMRFNHHVPRLCT